MTNLKMNCQLGRLEAYLLEVYLLLQIMVRRFFILTKVPRIFVPDFNNRSVAANCFSIETWTHSLHRQSRGTTKMDEFLNPYLHHLMHLNQIIGVELWFDRLTLDCFFKLFFFYRQWYVGPSIMFQQDNKFFVSIKLNILL